MKNQKRTIAVLSVIIVALFMAVLLLIFSLMLIKKESQISKSVDNDCFSMGFYPLNSSETEVFELQKDNVIDVSLVVMKGSLDIDIGQEGKKPIYEGHCVELNSFQVTVPEDGTYFITVSGQKAEGSISFQIHSQSTCSADSRTDGMEELLIGTLVDDSFYGKMIFALYTLDDKGIHQLVFDSSERNRCYYAGENRFAYVQAELIPFFEWIK